MLVQGLRRYAYTLKADSSKGSFAVCSSRSDWVFTNILTPDGTGYRTDNFSWTAALFIDLVNEFYVSLKGRLGLTKHLKGVISGGALLNGRGLPDVAPERLGAEVMRSIQLLRDTFYDTTRGRLDYHALKDSHEYKDYRLLTNGL